MSDVGAPFPSHGTPMPPSARPRWQALVVVLVIGLVIGAGGVGLAWVLTGQEPNGAAADAEATCALVRRAGQPDPDNQTTAFRRWTSAGSLADLAADADPRYRPLADALLEVTAIVSRTYEAAGPDFEREARKAQEFCDTL